MPKLVHVAGEPAFYCPGCGRLHRINVHKKNPVSGQIWTWNSDLEFPTFEPEVHIPNQCQFEIRLGIIRFGQDCPHRFKLKSMPLPDIPEGYIK